MKNNSVFSKPLPWRYLPNIPRNIKYFFKDIKYAFQRLKYGVSTSDCWSLDNFFLHTLYNGLVIYRKDMISYPWNLTSEEWENIVDEMIRLCDNLLQDPFDFLIDLDDNIPREEVSRRISDADRDYQNDLHDLCGLLSEWLPDLWW